MFSDLTDREHRVLILIGQVYCNSDTADRLVFSTKTERNHVCNILNKLQVADRAQATICARKARLGHNIGS